jgi:hypothetical protein
MVDNTIISSFGDNTASYMFVKGVLRRPVTVNPSRALNPELITVISELVAVTPSQPL